MDPVTLHAYDVGAAGYCEDWLTQPPPQDVQRLWLRYFQRGGATLDVGSGSGRDVDWLNRNGFPCTGVDTRDAVGRLYGAFPVDAVRVALRGSTLLYDAQEVSESSGKRVHRLVVRHPG